MPRAVLLALVLAACTTADPDGPPAPGDLAAPQPGASGVGYQIFVRSFADSDNDGSGDLAGIRQRLPYLSALGVETLWLTPIYPSPSYHGYDVTDHAGVHPQLGDLRAFADLVRDAHAAGLRVVLDLVINHTSTQHPWFRAASADPRSPEVGRYLFRDDNPNWRYSLTPGDPNPPLLFKTLAGATPPRYYYSIFSGALPDLNLRDPRVPAYFFDVAAQWLQRGADGFRLDAARYLLESPDPLSAPQRPAVADTAETHTFLRDLRAAVEKVRPGATLIGEVWTDTAAIATYHGGGRELTGAFAFPLAGAILDGVKRGVATPVQDALQAQLRGGVPPAFFVPFLSNHDQTRSATVLDNDPAKLRIAAALYLGLPGTPFVYYGEEVGLGQSQASGDQAKRTPMPWSEATRQQADPASLWRHYQRLLAARRATPALRDERLQLVNLTGGNEATLALLRGGEALLIYNLAATPLRGAQAAVPTSWVAKTPRDLLSDGALPPVTADNRARYPLPEIPARGARWLIAP